MKVDRFDFELPADRIALRPAAPRDSARMLVLDGAATHDTLVSDLPARLRSGDLLVFNDTRVIPAQLEGRRGDARIGATLHKREGPRRWRAFVRNARRLRLGDTVDFGAGVSALVSDRGADGSIAIDSRNSESLLRGCSALRIQILTHWLQGIPADLLEEEDVPPEAISDEMRVPFAAYTFLDQVQKIILEHLDPTVAET